MSRGPKRTRELKVKRTYEPGRLWQNCLEVAYERVVSKRTYMVHITLSEVDREEQERRVERKSA